MSTGQWMRWKTTRSKNSLCVIAKKRKITEKGFIFIWMNNDSTDNPSLTSDDVRGFCDTAVQRGSWMMIENPDAQRMDLWRITEGVYVFVCQRSGPWYDDPLSASTCNTRQHHRQEGLLMEIREVKEIMLKDTHVRRPWLVTSLCSYFYTWNKKITPVLKVGLFHSHSKIILIVSKKHRSGEFKDQASLHPGRTSAE